MQTQPRRCCSVAAIFLLSLLILAALPQTARASAGPSLPLLAQQQLPEVEARVEISASPVLAWNWRGILGNRTRMIQVSLVVVAIGISFLVWGKTK